MAQKEYEMQFKLNAKLEGGYSSAFRAAQQELAQMQNELQALNRLQNDISSYQKQQEALLGTRSKLEVLQQQYDNIQQEVNETEGFSATLENRLLSKQQQIEKTTAAIGKQEVALDRLESSLQEAGVDTDSLTSESRRLTEAYDSLRAEQEEIASAFQAGGANAKEFGDTTASTLGSVQDVLMSIGIAAALQKLDQEFQECMAATMEYESAITGVAKTTDLTEEELAEMSSAIQKMATEIPSSTTELAAVAEAAGQLGIQKDAILDFTEVMTMMGTATNMTAEEAATSLARFANITGTSSANYGRLGSVIVDLGNNFATTEREITEMSTRLASAGRLAGLTEAEIMALAASMSSVGIEAEAGGTAMTQTLNQIETAVATGGDSLEEFARIAGMSAEDFSAAWGTDTMQVIQNFVTGLGRLDEQGESAVLVLDELGLSGIRQSNMLKNLALSADSMGDAVSLATQAWEENTALQAEAEKRYATLQSQMVMMENSFNNLEVAVGEVFAPSLREAYEIAGSMADEAASFVQDNPEIVKALGITTAGVAGLTAGMGVYAVVTQMATAATTSFNLATHSFNLLVAGATVAISAAFTAAAFLLNETTEDVEELSAVSQEQYAELEDLKAQYADVCATYGETSEQAIELKERVDEATAAFEENRQTAQGIEDEYQEVMQAYTDMVAAYKEKLDAINDEEESATSLISELQRLMSIEEKTAGTKEQILGVVNLLNEAVPDLGLAYDQYGDSLNMTADAIIAVTEAEYERQRNEAQYQDMLDRISQRAELEAQIKEYTDQRIAAEKELADAIEARTEADEQKSKAIPMGGMAGFGQGLVDAGYTDDPREAQALVDDLTAHEEEARKAYEENEQTIKDLSQALADYNTEMQETGTSSQELNDVLNSYAEKAAALGEAAQAAYDAAYAGISGSFGLFDKVSLEIETSVSDMIAALDSQAQYIADYQSNLQAAMDMGIDEGLIAALSDGSQESAAYLQEIVNAGSGSVDELNAAFAKVQEGKDEFSKTVEEMQTDFAGQMDILLAELNATIGEMDLHDQAAQSGYNTVKGFTDAANDPEMQAYVRNAYAMMAEQATVGINSALDIHSPSGVTEWSGEMTGYGLIEGVENTIPDMQKAMREYAESAAEAMEASQIVMLSPTFMQQVSAMYAGNPESADEISVSPAFVGGSKVEMHVTYQITNNGDAGDLEEQLSRHDERLREMMLGILNEYEEDAKRTRFS